MSFMAIFGSKRWETLNANDIESARSEAILKDFMFSRNLVCEETDDFSSAEAYLRSVQGSEYWETLKRARLQEREHYSPDFSDNEGFTHRSSGFTIIEIVDGVTVTKDECREFMSPIAEAFRQELVDACKDERRRQYKDLKKEFEPCE